MHKSILILEESKMVHELFESALPQELWNWTINRESSPENYIVKARETSPDIIFLSNQDQKRNYATVRALRSSSTLNEVPILLLTSAKDKLDEKLLQSLGIRGFVRKPFESSTLQEQINIVLKEQENYQKHRPKDELKNINVVDDELMELLSGKSKSNMSIDELEVELDPTLKLVPNDIDIDQQEDDFDAEDDFEETELLEIDNAEAMEEDPDFDIEDDFEETELMEMEQGDFIDSDDSYLENENPDLIDVELEEIDSEDEFQDLSDDSEFDEIEMEPQSDDFDDYSAFETTSDPDQSRANYQTIQVFATYDPKFDTLLKNDPENKDDLGFMEINIVPLRRTPPKSNIVESISDDFDEDEFIREHSPNELPMEFLSSDSDFDLEDTSITVDDEIEIPHEEIIEDFHLGSDDKTPDEFENEGLLEISVEGMDEGVQDSENDFEDKIQDNEEESFVEIDVEFSSESDNLEEITDNFSVVEQDTIDIEDQDPELLEQESSVDLEIDFEEDSELIGFDDESLEELSLPDEMPDDFDNDSLDYEMSDDVDTLDIDIDGDAQGSSASIQEMIGFRQVIKAKYDIAGDNEEMEDIESDSDVELLLFGEETENDNLSLEKDTSDSEDFASKTDDDSMSDEFMAEVNDIDDDDSMDSELMEELDDTDDLDSMGDELLAEMDEDDSMDSELLAEMDDMDNDDSMDDDIFDDDDLFTDDIESQSGEEIDLFSTEDIENETDKNLDSFSDDFADQDESLEDIDLLSDDIDEDLTDTESDADFEEETELFSSEESEDEIDDVEFLMEEDESLQEDIDFQPIEETGSTDEFEPDSMEDDIESSIDDIDFLPVDEDEILAQGINEDLEDDFEQGTMDDIDFLPIEDPQLENDALDEEGETQQEEDEHDTSMNIIHAIEDADEIIIEVPHDTFEMTDFNIRDITDDDQPMEEQKTNIPVQVDTSKSIINLMEGIDIVKKEEIDMEKQELLEEIDLPSMDEDLPDLPPVLDVEQDFALEDPGHNIQLVEDDDSFEDFPDESSIIGPTEPDIKFEESTLDLTENFEKKRSIQMTAEFRDKLSAMIEGVISETVKSTLHDMLPEMMEKIIHEELED